MELYSGILVSLLNTSSVVYRPVWEAEAEADCRPKQALLSDHMKIPSILIYPLPWTFPIGLKGRMKMWIPKNHVSDSAQ
jgi:hypothetical protein